MILSILGIVIGLIILILGAEGLVRGASAIAGRLKVSPLVIGLTVVSFGTSAPELTVNLLAALQGSTDLAVANIVGSNIVNILLILGISAIIVPLTVKSSTVWKEIPLALLGVGLVFIMGNDQAFDGLSFMSLTRTDGIALLALMAIFMYYIFGMAKSDREKAVEKKINEEAEDDVPSYSFSFASGLTLAGLVGLVVGGRLLVDGAMAIADAAGMSEALVGLTIVAVGTSLPELATSVVAAVRRQADIAIGNVVGSNIFNVFFVLGATSTITPLPISAKLNFDIVFSIFATLLLFLFMFVGKRRRLTRWEGIMFVIAYIGYVVYLVIRG